MFEPSRVIKLRGSMMLRSFLSIREGHARKDRTLAPYEKMTRFRWSRSWWRWALTGLSTLALVLSVVLGWHYLVGGAMIGCGGGSPCDQVLNSRWSTIAGVLPVSGLAAGAYLAMLVASLFIGPATAASVRRLAWGAMLVLVGAAAGSAVWFTILQKWVIGVFCPYCMAAHITGMLLAALVLWRATMQLDDDSTDVTPRRMIAPLPAIGLALVGLVMAGILATCQVVLIPPAVYVDGESQDDVPAMDPHAVPLVGSPDALHVVTLLFDYTCPHCQQMHFMLDEVIRRYGGKLAFALRPAPLDSQCNPYIPRDADEFKDSCDLVRVGLAVWVARREAFAAFEHWMYTFESGDRWHPRSLEAARAKAVELVGQAEFDAAWGDPWIEKYMRSSIKIYGDTGGKAIPKLAFGSRWVIPEPYSADDLMTILQDGLVVPQP